MEVRAQYAYDTNAASDESALLCLDESLTDQSHRDDADINVLVRRFGVVELAARHPVALPSEVEFGHFDFQESMNLVRVGMEAFAAQTAEVRDEFRNDPARFVAFFSDPRNQERAIELGLANRKPVVVEPDPLKVRVVSDPEVK